MKNYEMHFCRSFVGEWIRTDAPEGSVQPPLGRLIFFQSYRKVIDTIIVKLGELKHFVDKRYGQRIGLSA